MIFTRFERLKCLHGNSLLSSSALALPARRMGVQSAGSQNVARHKCWALTWGNNNNKRRRQRRWHLVSALPPSLSHSLSLSLSWHVWSKCSSVCKFLQEPKKNSMRPLCEQTAKQAINTHRDRQREAKRERERGRGIGTKKTKQEHKMGTLINSTKTQLNATSATDANVVVEENHY